MDLENYISNSTLKIIVRPNAHSNEITGFDEEKKAVRVNIKAPADKNKANIEVIKFFSKLLKKKVRIKTGLKSKEKILQV